MKPNLEVLIPERKYVRVRVTKDLTDRLVGYCLQNQNDFFSVYCELV